MVNRFKMQAGKNHITIYIFLISGNFILNASKGILFEGMTMLLRNVVGIYTYFKAYEIKKKSEKELWRSTKLW